MSGEGVHNPADTTTLEEAIAIVQADVNGILDSVAHTSIIFPADTNLICTFTALNTANTFSAWAEIVDSMANKLSDAIGSTHGHISSILVETMSEDSAIYMYEIAYGAAKTVIVRERFAGVGKFIQANMQNRFWTLPFPTGQLLYYRMKTETAVADTCTVHFRCHSE